MLIKRVYELDPLTCPEYGGGRIYRTASGRDDQKDPARAPERSDGRQLVALIDSRNAAGNAGRDGLDGYGRSGSDRKN